MPPGSQNLRGEVIAESLRRTVDMVLRLAQDAPAPVRYVNPGWGWGYTVFPGERRLDLAPVFEALAQTTARLAQGLPAASWCWSWGDTWSAGRYLRGARTRYKVSRGQVFW